MKDFDDSVERELTRRRDEAAKRGDEEVERQRRQATAADEIQRALVDLATYLGRKIQPRRVKIAPNQKRKWHQPARWSPAGFVIRYTPDGPGDEIKLLLPNGSLWWYGRILHGPPAEGIVDIEAKMQWGFDLGVGELAGSPGRYSTPGGIAGPSRNPCALSDYMARLATHIIGQAS
ncbi:hypothetical protein ACWDYH_38965 [Nocardia goodfellowii]